jgi:hypothetical protein
MTKKLHYLLLFFVVLQSRDLESVNLMDGLTQMKNQLINLRDQLRGVPPKKLDNNFEKLKNEAINLFNSFWRELSSKEKKGERVDPHYLTKFNKELKSVKKNLNYKQWNEVVSDRGLVFTEEDLYNLIDKLEEKNLFPIEFDERVKPAIDAIDSLINELLLVASIPAQKIDSSRLYSFDKFMTEKFLHFTEPQIKFLRKYRGNERKNLIDALMREGRIIMPKEQEETSSGEESEGSDDEPEEESRERRNPSEDISSYNEVMEKVRRLLK